MTGHGTWRTHLKCGGIRSGSCQEPDPEARDHSERTHSKFRSESTMPQVMSGKQSGEARYRTVTLVSLIAAITQIILGGVVRVTGSGDACPDWPLCHGQIIPPFRLPHLARIHPSPSGDRGGTPGGGVTGAGLAAHANIESGGHRHEHQRGVGCRGGDPRRADRAERSFVVDPPHTPGFGRTHCGRSRHRLAGRTPRRSDGSTGGSGHQGVERGTIDLVGGPERFAGGDPSMGPTWWGSATDPSAPVGRCASGFGFRKASGS